MQARNRNDWADYDPAKIPTKTHMPHVEHWQLLQNIREALAPKGKLSISFSGLSDDINQSYAELYAADHPHTGEYGTYLSRDASGRVLYQTHHFAGVEIQKLLQDQGFREIRIQEKIEASSRRPDQRARSHYVTCERNDSKIRKMAMVDAHTPPHRCRVSPTFAPIHQGWLYDARRTKGKALPRLCK
jgi:hypothetical protein